MSAVEEAKNLIEIPSVTKNEKALALYLEDEFASIGCKTELVEVDTNRFNIMAVLEGELKEETGVLFHGHMDTVAPYGMKDPFDPKIEDDHIWGRGSVDQKGGIAAVIEAFQQIVFSGTRLKKNAAFIGVIDEEEEHRGSMLMSSMGIKADFAVITEPSGLKVGIGCKGTAPIQMNVRGRASHGCRPWLGESAVIHGMNIVSELLKTKLSEYNVPGIGDIEGTINLGIIKGGTAYNIVPAECLFWFDRRLVPGETIEDAVAQIRSIADTCALPDDVTVELEVARPDWNWTPIKQRGLLPAVTDRNSLIVQTVEKIHRKTVGTAPDVYFTDGYNEMDFLINDLGIPTVHYGPGDGALCHTAFERLSIPELETAAEVYAGTIRSICTER